MAQARQWAGKGLPVTLSVRLEAGGTGHSSRTDHQRWPRDGVDEFVLQLPQPPSIPCWMCLARIPAETHSWEKNNP